MKALVKLNYSVEPVVEGKNETAISDWLASTTPEEAKKLAAENVDYVNESYSEEIIYEVEEDACVDYVIE